MRPRKEIREGEKTTPSFITTPLPFHTLSLPFFHTCFFSLVGDDGVADVTQSTSPDPFEAAAIILGIKIHLTLMYRPQAVLASPPATALGVVIGESF